MRIYHPTLCPYKVKRGLCNAIYFPPVQQGVGWLLKSSMDGGFVSNTTVATHCPSTTAEDSKEERKQQHLSYFKYPQSKSGHSPRPSETCETRLPTGSWRMPARSPRTCVFGRKEGEGMEGRDLRICHPRSYSRTSCTGGFSFSHSPVFFFVVFFCPAKGDVNLVHPPPPLSLSLLLAPFSGETISLLSSSRS